MPTLYVVATPIGNLQDMTPRAVQVLQRVGLIAAEDTRVTMKLCQVFDIHTPLTSCHRHNEENKGNWLAEKMLEENMDAAVVTDAGTPCISDPGYGMIQACLQRGIQVLPVPGCCAAIAALSICGFDTREFTFYGFLPRENRELKEKLLSIREAGDLAVVHESPYRVKDLMRVIADLMPETMVSASCDLTKLHELTIRGTACDVLLQLEQNEKSEKGEYCIVLDLSRVPKREKKVETDISTEARILDLMVREGMTMREAMQKLQDDGEKKNALKAASIHLKKILEE